MHITEGIITGSAAILYTVAGVGLVGLGARNRSWVLIFTADAPQ